ncbi:hypothetical protein GDO78_016620 [Eleutherodactylus coqui]|uniref:TIL domain-containing protein n=1 Tax=Eleutherodactylus coqui TaxID=57060 RepID=A0A8J6E7Y5_ELECQ|nr:hypothetical protein GDO78_016620 [Eleutherodactylus coqui]
MRPVSVLLLVSLSAAFILISTDIVPPNKECPQNMTYTCGTMCPEICNEPKPTVCNKMCRMDCFCIENYVFVNKNLKNCVLPQDCPPK